MTKIVSSWGMYVQKKCCISEKIMGYWRLFIMWDKFGIGERENNIQMSHFLHVGNMLHFGEEQGSTSLGKC